MRVRMRSRSDIMYEIMYMRLVKKTTIVKAQKLKPETSNTCCTVKVSVDIKANHVLS